MTSSDKLLTPAELVEKYPVSLSTIYAACQTGSLRHYRIPARKGARGKYLILEADWHAWLESHRHGGDEEARPTDAQKPLRHIIP